MDDGAHVPRSGPLTDQLRGKELEAGVNVPAAGDVEAQPGQPELAQNGGAPGAGPAARAHVSDLTSIPNGGLMAWLQVAGSFFLFFNTW